MSREWKSEGVTDGDGDKAMAEDEVTGVHKGVRGGLTGETLTERKWELLYRQGEAYRVGVMQVDERE